MQGQKVTVEIFLDSDEPQVLLEAGESFTAAYVEEVVEDIIAAGYARRFAVIVRSVESGQFEVDEAEFVNGMKGR